MKSCQVIKLGPTHYEEALAFQRNLFQRRHRQEIEDSLILTEHFPVYTCGRSANPDSLIVGKLPKGVQFLKVDRGGSLTFHGPGQLMVYPIISLKSSENIMAYLRKLEQVVIRTVAVYGIKASSGRYSGVWVGSKKLASLGIKVSCSITMHGLALNVNCDLDYFKPILACGLKARQTSMYELLGYKVEVQDLADLIILNFGKVFYYRMKEAADEQYFYQISC